MNRIVKLSILGEDIGYVPVTEEIQSILEAERQGRSIGIPPHVCLSTVDHLNIEAANYRELFESVEEKDDVGACPQFYALMIPDLGFKDNEKNIEMIMVAQPDGEGKIPVLKGGKVRMRKATELSITSETFIITEAFIG